MRNEERGKVVCLLRAAPVSFPCFSLSSLSSLPPRSCKNFSSFHYYTLEQQKWLGTAIRQLFYQATSLFSLSQQLSSPRYVYMKKQKSASVSCALSVHTHPSFLTNRIIIISIVQFIVCQRQACMRLF